VDYLENIESSGRAVLNFLMLNQEIITEKTSKLREVLSERQPSYRLVDNDSWRLVNYIAPF